LSNSNLPISSTSPVDSIPYQAPNYSGDIIEQLKSEISLLEYKLKQIQDPNSFGLVDQAKIDGCNKAVADFMATAKFGAGADLEAIKKEQFDACMTRTA
jgi:hypothetical protein